MATEGRPAHACGARSPRARGLQGRADRHEDHARRCSPTPRRSSPRTAGGPITTSPLTRRQICWSHLQRDFQAHAEGLGAETRLRPARAARLRAAVLGLGGLPAHPRPQASSNARSAAAPRTKARSCAIPRQIAALQTQPRPRAQPAQSSGPHSGRSPPSPACNRPTTTPNAPSAAPSSTASSPSAANPSKASNAPNDSSPPPPPAAYNTAASTPTSPNSSTRPPAATQPHYSANPLNAYKKPRISRAFVRWAILGSKRWVGVLWNMEWLVCWDSVF